MPEPTFSNPQDSEIYYLTKRVMALEKAEQERKTPNLAPLEERIKVLEDARQRQITLNSTFAERSHTHDFKTENATTTKWPKWFW